MLHAVRISVFALAFATSQTLAQTDCPMTYAEFEFAVPHLDLPDCPSDLTREETFCRASTANDAVHVFVFSRRGKQCLLAMKSYKEGQYQFSVK
jgi:hypothetical protein